MTNRGVPIRCQRERRTLSGIRRSTTGRHASATSAAWTPQLHLETDLCSTDHEAMKHSLDELILYLRLAQAFKNRLKMADRDRALVLAGVTAARLGLSPVAEFCRQIILQHNHGHMVRRWKSFEEAIQDPDFLHFLKQVRRKVPLERAESLLIELGYECDVRREDYPDDLAFAAAIMGVDSQWLTEHYG